MAVRKKTVTVKKKVAVKNKVVVKKKGPKKVTVKKKVKVKKKVTVKKTITKAPKSEVKDAPPAYFLSLSVENIKCFGPKQTIDLSDSKGRPAQWTVILGDNNTGKTTLLQSFVAVEPSCLLDEMPNHSGGYPSIFGRHHPWSFLSARMSGKELSYRKVDSKGSVCIDFELFCGAKLRGIADHANIIASNVTINFNETGYFKSGSSSLNGTSDQIKGLLCYGYGASRVMGEASLTDKMNDLFVRVAEVERGSGGADLGRHGGSP